MKYKYKGKTTIRLKGIGVVKPGDVIDTKKELDSKLFEKVKIVKSKKDGS